MRQVHAEKTERFLTGRRLTEAATLSGALETLLEEVQPEHDPELADVTYRRRLASSLLYKVSTAATRHLQEATGLQPAVQGQYHHHSPAVYRRPPLSSCLLGPAGAVFKLRLGRSNDS